MRSLTCHTCHRKPCMNKRRLGKIWCNEIWLECTNWKITWYDRMKTILKREKNRYCFNSIPISGTTSTMCMTLNRRETIDLFEIIPWNSLSSFALRTLQTEIQIIRCKFITALRPVRILRTEISMILKEKRRIRKQSYIIKSVITIKLFWNKFIEIHQFCKQLPSNEQC